MLLLAFLIAAAAAAPATYDQRQDGDFNVRADVQNVVFLVAYPQKMNIPPGFFDGLLKSTKHAPELQERADVHVMEAFVEPNEPYHVEIGESDRQAGGDGRAVEVVIAGRRRPGVEAEAEAQAEPQAEPQTEQQAEPQAEQNEYKLLGAMEQCGPDRERDPVTLTCRAREQPTPAPAQPDSTLKNLAAQLTPEVVPAST